MTYLVTAITNRSKEDWQCAYVLQKCLDKTTAEEIWSESRDIEQLQASV